MYVITLCAPANATTTAHPYLPTSTCEACMVARELSRDYIGLVATIRELGTGTIVRQYQYGHTVR